jgi:AMP-binding enzyme
MSSRTGSPKSLARRLEEVALRRAERPAVIDGDVVVTFAELWVRSGRAARALRAHGIASGEPIASWSPNTVESIVVQCAALRAGTPAVHLDPDGGLEHAARALAETRVRVLFTRASHEGRQYPAMIKSIRRELPDLEHVVVHGRAARFERVLRGGWVEFLESGDVCADASGNDSDGSWRGPMQSPVAILFSDGRRGARRVELGEADVLAHDVDGECPPRRVATSLHENGSLIRGCLAPLLAGVPIGLPPQPCDAAPLRSASASQAAGRG